MKKYILYIIISLLVLLVVNAIEECDSPIEPSDVPCMVISTYQFGVCTDFTAMVFDTTNTPTLLDTRTYSDYGITGRCNVTFNYTTRGSYLLNSSEGSSATIIVKGVRMDFLRLTIFGILFLVGLVFIAFMHIFKDDQVSIVYGFFGSAIYTLLGALGMFGFVFLALDGVTLPFDINRMLGLIAIIMAVYCAWISTSIMKERKRPRMDELGEEIME